MRSGKRPKAQRKPGFSVHECRKCGESRFTPFRCPVHGENSVEVQA